MALGDYDLHNSGNQNVTIISATLPGVHRLTVTRAWVVPVYHDPKNGNWLLIGTAHWPPGGPQWPQRRPAIGAVIRPGHDLNLVFGLTRTSGTEGHSGGAIVTYSSGGAQYVFHGSIAYMVAQDCFTQPGPWNGS
jgi:hypothetical protein